MNILILHFLGLPIFSIDIHPDGSRFATGGQGEVIVFLIYIYIYNIILINGTSFSFRTMHEINEMDYQM
jgi:hypothetical protein